MLKKNNLAVFAVMVIGFLSLLTSDINAQKTVSVKTNLPTTSADSDILQKYIEVSSLPNGERQKAFSEVSNEMKAKLFRFHLAFQFAKRPNLSNDQKGLILDAIMSASPDVYDTKKTESSNRLQLMSVEARAKSVFQGREGYEIFANLASDTNDIEIFKNYQEISSIYNLIERKDAFRQSTPVEKSQLWETHLSLKLAGLTNNQDQMNLIVELITLIDSDTYTITEKSEKWKALDEKLSDITKRIHENFSKKEAFEIFARLGGEGSSKSPTPTKQKPNCSCSTRSDYCWGDSCLGGSCNGSSRGCGTIYIYECNGMCYDV
jgi:rubrerythrin